MSMLANKEAAARHWNSGLEGREAREARRESGEMRLQAPVVVDRETDERDPYADVPCTD